MTETSTTALALIGCGRIAQLVHLAALSSLRRAEVAALAEPDAGRLREAARHVPRATLYADYRELLARSDAEAVVLTLPTDLHADAAIAAFAAGRHVYVEKPLAVDLHQADAVLDAEARSGKLGMIGFNFRFHPLYVALQRELRSGSLGRIVAMHSVFCAAGRALPDWKVTRRTGGGALLTLASHHIDMARFLLEQEVQAVSAFIRSVRTEDDTAGVQMWLEDGTLAQLFVSLTSAEEDRIEIFGERGKLSANRYDGATLEFTPAKRRLARTERIFEAVRAGARLPSRAFALVRPPTDSSHKAALQAFVDAVQRQQRAPVSLEEGYRSLAIVMAAEESAKSGRKVAVRAPCHTNSAVLLHNEERRI